MKYVGHPVKAVEAESLKATASHVKTVKETVAPAVSVTNSISYLPSHA